MNDIDFDALDKAVSQQMAVKTNPVKKVVVKPPKIIKKPVSNQVRINNQPKLKSSGKAMDFLSGKQAAIAKQNTISVKKVAKKAPKAPLKVRKNNAVSKTIEDIFRPQSTKSINRQTVTKTSLSKTVSKDPINQLKPVEINQKFASDNGQVIGHYQSKTISKQTDQGDITYRKDKLDYVANFSDDLTPQKSKLEVIDHDPVETIKPTSQSNQSQSIDVSDQPIKSEQSIESKKAAKSPFLDNAKIEKRPLGVPENAYKPRRQPEHNHEELLITKTKKNPKSSTALYRQDSNLAEVKPKKKSASVWLWLTLITILLGVIVFVSWLLLYNN